MKVFCKNLCKTKIILSFSESNVHIWHDCPSLQDIKTRDIVQKTKNFTIFERTKELCQENKREKKWSVKKNNVYVFESSC